MTLLPMPKITVAESLHAGTQILGQTGISTARLDCLVLLEDVLQTSRAQLLAHPERKLTPGQQHLLQKLIKRRAAHEPLAYLRHKTEFYGREFYIDHHVLEPRPESETMIDLLKQLALPDNTVVADIGTGSGALAITAKLELPKAVVIGIDIDPSCLTVATRNAHKLNAAVTFLEGNLLDPLVHLDSRPAVLLCNLPYVPDSFQINPAAMREPRIAIFGGTDGLNLYRAMFTQLRDLAQKPRYILTEAMPPQHSDLRGIAASSRYTLANTDDFIQVFTTT